MLKGTLPNRPLQLSKQPAYAISLCLALLCLVVAGCQTDTPTSQPTGEKGTETTMNESDFPKIFYAAFGGAPTVDQRLAIETDGAASLYIGSSDSIMGDEVDEVGFYTGTIAASERQKLLDLVDTHNLAKELADREAISPDPVTGYLTLQVGEESQQLVFAEIDNVPGAVEVTRLLNRWMISLLDSPERTVRAELVAGADANGVNLVLSLLNQGTDPLPLILYSDKMASQFLKMNLSVYEEADLERLLPVATANLDRDSIAGFVDEGLINSGWHELPPEAPLTLELPPINDLTPGQYQIQATFIFWLPGDGLEERLVYLRPKIATVSVPE